MTPPILSINKTTVRKYMTVEMTRPLGGYRVSDIICGYYVSKLYLGYTKRDAVVQFREDVARIIKERKLI